MYDSACVYQGDFSAYYLCTTCKKILESSDFSEGWGFGELADNLQKGQTPEDLLTEMINSQYDIL